MVAALPTLLELIFGRKGCTKRRGVSAGEAVNLGRWRYRDKPFFSRFGRERGAVMKAIEAYQVSVFLEWFRWKQC